MGTESLFSLKITRAPCGCFLDLQFHKTHPNYASSKNTSETPTTSLEPLNEHQNEYFWNILLGETTLGAFCCWRVDCHQLTDPYKLFTNNSFYFDSGSFALKLSTENSPVILVQEVAATTPTFWAASFLAWWACSTATASSTWGAQIQWDFLIFCLLRGLHTQKRSRAAHLGAEGLWRFQHVQQLGVVNL